MTRSTVHFVLATLACLQITPLAPAQEAAVRFEAASIKPAAPLTREVLAVGVTRLGLNILPGRVDGRYVSLSQLIARAYKVSPLRISGPEWLIHPAPFESPMFDVQATMPKGAMRGQVPEMLRALLVERFHLAVHREARVQPIYALVVGDQGAKLKPANMAVPPSGDADASEPEAQLRNGNSVRPVAGMGGGGTLRITGPDGDMNITNGHGISHIEAFRLNMSTLAAEFLSHVCDRPVTDETGLKDDYQMTLDLPTDGPTAKDPTGVPLGTLNATLVKLGLKLERKTGPVEYLVVDRVEKSPTDN